MSCSQCVGIEEEFDPKYARRDLKRYAKKGPKKTTKWLVEAIVEQGLPEPSVLDIGGGVGEIQHELAVAGAGQITGVDASSSFVEQCRLEAERRGYGERSKQHFGDFTELHDEIESADVVTLDRVICCFDDVDALVAKSVAKAKRLYGLVYPRETFLTSIGSALINIVQRIRRSPFSVFVHSSERVDAMICERGLKRVFFRQSLLWQVVLYEA